MYFDYQDGNSRSEMKANIPQMPGGGMSLSCCIWKILREKSFRLDEKKNIRLKPNSSESRNGGIQANDYEVTVLGKEKVNGYSCTHLTIKKKTNYFPGRNVDNYWD